MKRKAAWIKKYGDTKAVKKWLAENPPPPTFEGSPQEYAFEEMEEEPIDDPLEPDLEEFPQEAAVTRREVDELRNQVARTAKTIRRAIKRTRAVPLVEPPTPPDPLAPPTPPVAKPGGLAGILSALERH